MNCSYTSISNIRNLIENKIITPTELINQYLINIKRENSFYNAFIEIYEKDAKLSAKKSELRLNAGNKVRSLEAVPVAIKDVIDIAGSPTRLGGFCFNEKKALSTATVVRSLTDAGAIVVGKTHTVEFALGGWGTNQNYGTPRNPVSATGDHAPGGSSSGSAVAVAAGLVPIAIGTDTGGSIRIPAAWCGISGLKVSAERFSHEGLVPLSETLDTIGPLARNVEDLAEVYRAIVDDDLTSTNFIGKEIIRNARVFVLSQDELQGLNNEMLSAYSASISQFRHAGAVITCGALPFSTHLISKLNTNILFFEAYQKYSEIAKNENVTMDEDVRLRILSGGVIKRSAYLESLNKRIKLCKLIERFFNNYDCILMPTTEITAPRIQTINQTLAPTRFVRFANYLNLPALVLPNGKCSSGLPISLQIVCANKNESKLIKYGIAYQKIMHSN